jgi:hypothetical protein
MNRKKLSITVLILFASILFSSCGPGQLFGPTNTPVPTNTPIPTNTTIPTNTPAPPTATATNTPIPPTPTPEFEQYYTEEFEKDLKYWPNFIVSESGYGGAVIAKEPTDEIKLSAEDGFFKFDIEKTWQYVYSTYDPFEYEDVRLDVSAENLGTNNNSISLVCRYTKDSGWYEFNMANSGVLSILYAKVRPEDGYVSYTLIAEGGSNKIKQGMDVNEYSAICKDDTLTLYVNGNLTKETKDNRLTSGKVGISVSSFPSLPVKVNFDWVKISQP